MENMGKSGQVEFGKFLSIPGQGNFILNICCL